MSNATYAENADEAIKLLTVAIVYIEDGAPSTALDRIERCLVHLNKMIAHRDREVARKTQGGR